MMNHTLVLLYVIIGHGVLIGMDEACMPKKALFSNVKAYQRDLCHKNTLLELRKQIQNYTTSLQQQPVSSTVVCDNNEQNMACAYAWLDNQQQECVNNASIYFSISWFSGMVSGFSSMISFNTNMHENKLSICHMATTIFGLGAVMSALCCGEEMLKEREYRKFKTLIEAYQQERDQKS